MRNLVAKHNYHRAATHSTNKSYSRKWSMDWDEIEPPKVTSIQGIFGGSIV